METELKKANVLECVTFYPTYEEWKLNSAHDTSPIAFAFLSYLWGMETSMSSSSASSFLFFLSYLWGMETILAYLLFSFLYPPFYPTYEEWKQCFESLETDEEFHFLSYLWGMETIQ